MMMKLKRLQDNSLLSEPLSPLPADESEGSAADAHEQPGTDMLDVLLVLARNFKTIMLGSLAAGFIALGVAYILPPTFTAHLVLLPPQQQQSAASSALQSLGALAALAGNATALKSPVEQYVSLFRSNTVTDRIIDRYKLIEAYDVDLRTDARKKLAARVRVVAGKKDGLITIDVDDRDPKRAADIANSYVEELHALTNVIAVSEAQQRRMFFEKQLESTKKKLTQAQIELQASGFAQGALNTEPKAAAEAYARLKAQVAAAEVRLSILKGYMNESATEYQQVQSTLIALRAQLVKAEQSMDPQGGPDYVGKYREFKYQETLFELMARQYEAARVDESREGALIQVIDPATPPERKSWPRRSLFAGVAFIAAMLLLGSLAVLRQSWRTAKQRPETAEKLAELQEAFFRRRN